MDSDDVCGQAALARLAQHFRSMPPVAALQLRIDGFDGESLSLQAPLAAHVNDKGCAFGGSLASLMTLACWGVVTLRLLREGLDADVFVADTQLHYRAPLFADLHAQAQLADAGAWPGFVARFRERGRASVRLHACVRLPDGGIAAESQARYVAIGKG
jgi:thioesterase domain-containing protein